MRWDREQRRSGNPAALTNMSGYFVYDAERLGEEHGLQIDIGILSTGVYQITCNGQDCGRHIGNRPVVIGGASANFCLDYLESPQDVVIERLDQLNDLQVRAYFSLEGSYTSLFSAYEAQTGPHTTCRPGECIRFRDDAVMIACIGPNGSTAFQTDPVPRDQMRQVNHRGRPRAAIDIRAPQCFADFRKQDGAWVIWDTYTPFFSTAR